MTRNKFPKGWDEERVRRVLEHYENRTEEEAVAEDEVAAKLDVDKLLRTTRATARKSGLNKNDLNVAIQEVRKGKKSD